MALSRAAAYAKERIVFNRPIGKNQAIQHPLAKNWMELEAAWLMTLSAAWQYDQGMPCGAAANAAKYLAAEAGFQACEQAVMTHGGFGYAKEFHVERYLREIPDSAHRADQPAAYPELHRRESSRLAEVLLGMGFEVMKVINSGSPFPSASKMRTRNFADSGSGPSDHPGMTTSNEVLLP